MSTFQTRKTQQVTEFEELLYNYYMGVITPQQLKELKTKANYRKNGGDTGY